MTGSGVTVYSGTEFPLGGVVYFAASTFSCNSVSVSSSSVVFSFNEGNYTIQQLLGLGWFLAKVVLNCYTGSSNPILQGAYLYDSSYPYSSAHDLSSARGVFPYSNSIAVGQSVEYTIYRGFLFFDTSSIPTNSQIYNATLSLYSYSHTGAGYSVVVQSGQPVYPHFPVVSTDFNYIYYDGNYGSVDSSSLINGGYNNITLSNYNQLINKEGTTKLALRTDEDINNIAPDTPNLAHFGTGFNSHYCQLTIWYGASPSGTVNLTINSNSLGVTNPVAGIYSEAILSYVQVTATPINNTVKFLNWVLNGSIISSSNPYSVFMAGNEVLEPEYTTYYYLTVLDKSTAWGNGNGTTDPTVGTYLEHYNTYVSITATPQNSSYYLYKWVLNGVQVAPRNPLLVLMGGNETVQPIFERISNPVVYIYPVDGGVTSPAEDGLYILSPNTVFTITAYPNIHYHFSYWLINDLNVGSNNPHSFLATNMTYFITPVFSVDSYTFTFNNPNGATGYILDEYNNVYVYGTSYIINYAPVNYIFRVRFSGSDIFSYWVVNGVTSYQEYLYLTPTQNYVVNVYVLYALPPILEPNFLGLTISEWVGAAAVLTMLMGLMGFLGSKVSHVGYGLVLGELAGFCVNVYIGFFPIVWLVVDIVAFIVLLIMYHRGG